LILVVIRISKTTTTDNTVHIFVEQIKEQKRKEKKRATEEKTQGETIVTTKEGPTNKTRRGAT
jgi:hypothetical protein